jgi:hypothetical protein
MECTVMDKRSGAEDGSVRRPFLDTLPFHACEVLAALTKVSPEPIEQLEVEETS